MGKDLGVIMHVLIYGNKLPWLHWLPFRVLQGSITSKDVSTTNVNTHQTSAIVNVSLYVA